MHLRYTGFRALVIASMTAAAGCAHVATSPARTSCADGLPRGNYLSDTDAAYCYLEGLQAAAFRDSGLRPPTREEVLQRVRNLPAPPDVRLALERDLNEPLPTRYEDPMSYLVARDLKALIDEAARSTQEWRNVPPVG